MARVAKYTCRTKFLCLTIKARYMDQHYWFIDAVFAVHDNMRSHTGAYATFWKGTINDLAKGQQINTASSTETKVIGVHENIPAIL